MVFSPCSIHIRNSGEISEFNTQFARLSRFNTQFAWLSKYNTGHANFFRM
uniref:Uncharacterized protein n=1 Tax=Arundo donax TaxID=35708 RepID=A0A0A9BVC6_ARUDO